MPEGQYIAAVSPEDIEWERVGLIEAMCDGITTRCLEALGVASGWRCIDVGAGAAPLPAGWRSALVHQATSWRPISIHACYAESTSLPLLRYANTTSSPTT